MDMKNAYKYKDVVFNSMSKVIGQLGLTNHVNLAALSIPKQAFVMGHLELNMRIGSVNWNIMEAYASDMAYEFTPWGPQPFVFGNPRFTLPQTI